MKKAKSLLAILLALTLVLALAPTTWAASGHTVTITANEGIEVTGGTTSGSKTDGNNVTVSYRVEDGYENPQYKVQIANNDSYSQIAPSELNGTYTLTVPDSDINGDVTIALSATKTPKTIKVTFAPGGDNVTNMPDPSTMEKKEGESYTLPDDAPKREGYTFIGWNDGAGNTYDPKDNCTLPNADVTFTAQWAQNFTITYTDGGNASVTDLPANQNTYENATIQLDNKEPKLAGFDFLKWKDADGNTYTANQTITVTKSLTLTPVWGKPVNVTYTENGSSSAPEKKYKDDEITLKDPQNTPEDKIFTGWKCSLDDKIYKAGEKYKLGENDVTFTAQYGVKVTINYELNATDATSTPPTNTVVGGGTTFKAPAAPTRTDTTYKFRGWKASWDGKVYQAGDTVTAPAAADAGHTLTAQWAQTVTINFATGTSVSVGNMPASLEADKDGSFTAPSKPSRNDSYVFTGWRASWNNVKYLAGATVPTPASNGTMTAEWEKKYYPDYGNGGSGGSSGGGTVNTYYSIDASCSSGGYISPDGRTSVKRGNNLTVTWGPKNGYVIDGVYIDGVLNNRYDGSYTFRDVDESHTIYVRYVRDSGSSGGGSSGGSDTSPKTSDPGMPIALLLGLSGAALATLFYARKRARS